MGRWWKGFSAVCFGTNGFDQPNDISRSYWLRPSKLEFLLVHVVGMTCSLRSKWSKWIRIVHTPIPKPIINSARVPVDRHRASEREREGTKLEEGCDRSIEREREQSSYFGGFFGGKHPGGEVMDRSFRNRGSVILLGLLLAGKFFWSDLSGVIFGFVSSIMISGPRVWIDLIYNVAARGSVLLVPVRVYRLYWLGFVPYRWFLLSLDKHTFFP